MKNTVRTLEEGRRSFFKRTRAGGVVTGATLFTLGAHMALNA